MKYVVFWNVTPRGSSTTSVLTSVTQRNIPEYGILQLTICSRSEVLKAVTVRIIFLRCDFMSVSISLSGFRQKMLWPH
jgi:hypothetical protein